MGLSIHYSGYIINKAMIIPLIEEVEDICKALNWSTHIIDDEEIKGISFAPAGSEPVFLFFNTDGRIVSLVNLVSQLIPGDMDGENILFTASTKTQYAGADAHIAIIRLLKHLSKKYLKDFTLTDEGYYWETGDENILRKQFRNYQAAIDTFCEALKDFPSGSNETVESLADRLERCLKEKFGREME
ncbi:hypothetical protein BH20BAC1_BH20BAC1_22720 [soil metagenome]